MYVIYTGYRIHQAKMRLLLLMMTCLPLQGTPHKYLVMPRKYCVCTRVAILYHSRE